jgi:phage/plasmid-like protein (TIGR03299 family)
MSHELTIRANGKVEMAFAGDIPWHGLGTQMVRGAPIEEWITAAGMDWKVLKAFPRFPGNRADISNPDSWRKVTDKVILFRSDIADESSDYLGVVSADYKVVQPKTILEFFRDLVGSAGLEIETAGTMFGGKKLWAMAHVSGSDHPVADARDKMKMNLLLATSLDGSLATTGMWIATRVVCNNTIRIGLSETDALRVKVRHSTEFDAGKVQKELGLKAAETIYERAMREMREMADKRMRESDVILTTARLVAPDYDELKPEDQKKVLNRKPVQTISQLALDRKAMGSEYDGTDGTVWQWLNATTQYVDHLSGKANTTTDNRMQSAWFGAGADLKERAYGMALEYKPTPISGTLESVIARTNAIFNGKNDSNSDQPI